MQRSPETAYKIKEQIAKGGFVPAYSNWKEHFLTPVTHTNVQ